MKKYGLFLTMGLFFSMGLSAMDKAHIGWIYEEDVNSELVKAIQDDVGTAKIFPVQYTFDHDLRCRQFVVDRKFRSTSYYDNRHDGKVEMVMGTWATPNNHWRLIVAASYFMENPYYPDAR